MVLSPELLNLAAQAASTLELAELTRVFDSARPGSRPTRAQQAIFSDMGRIKYRYVVAGNQSGKSALAAREIAWILQDSHPTWTRPARWGTGPLTVIIAGQDRKMMELELWGNKLARFLNRDEWREVRAGQALQYCEHRTMGHRIVFISHADSSEKNMKHMQGYVAHYVWLDEMPMHIRVLEELQRRVDSNDGYFVATFTPKFRNLKIKKLVEAIREPIGRRYRLSKLDNPLFAGQREKELAQLAGHSAGYIASVLDGEWMSGDGAIYEVIPEKHAGVPAAYSPGWRHVLWVDPATESKLGLELWAEDPVPLLGSITDEEPAGRRMWWCVRAEYVEGIYTPTKIVADVESRVAGHNIIERRSDSAASWYIRQAADMPDGRNYEYVGVEKKTLPGRKDGLIKEFQQALGERVRIADWCTEYFDELQAYERDPETGRIRAESRFHLIDCGHYFVDSIPAPDHQYVYASWTERFYQAALLEAREDELRAAHSPRRRRYAVTSGPPLIERPLPRLRQPGGAPRGRLGRRKYQVE